MSRSFGNFLATEGNLRREEEAAALEAEAQQLVEAFKASATSRAKELNVSRARDTHIHRAFAYTVFALCVPCAF